MSKKLNLPEPNDILVFKLENGMFGALRILRYSGDSKNVLVGCCEWCANTVVSVFKPEDFKTIVKLTHNSWDNELCLAWVGGAVPDSFSKVGEVKPLVNEIELSCDRYTRWESFPIHRYDQWVWDQQH